MRPIVFIHEGSQKYLQKAITKAVEWDNYVILIGDNSNQSYADNWVDVNTLKLTRYNQFKNIYKHMSKNPAWFELLCFKRYFELQDLAEKMKLDDFIMCDSDLMVYGDLSKHNYGDCEAAFSYCKNQDNFRWSASPHCSYWTKSALDSFIDFLFDVYNNRIATLQTKWEYHVKNNAGGGICDMTLLYLWKEEHKDSVKNTACATDNGMVFDHMVARGEGFYENEFETVDRFCVKKIIFRDGIPYFIRKEDHCEIRALTLHAQGKSKIYIPLFSAESNSFIRYCACNIKYYLDTPKRRAERKRKESE